MIAKGKSQSIIEYVLILATILGAIILGAFRIRAAVSGGMNNAARVVDSIVQKGL
ncbi:MAG: Flp family type IVb pilin [Candidatus Omnitrophica bacterium]|jgi:hypothetical protein|nr:Flp family type IVb pilin [Candidatus Omnitrophota bacterium]